MWVHVLFIVTSFALLAWWFRYTCMLILSSRPTTNHAAAVARVNALRFPEIQRKLEDQNVGERAHLDMLKRALVGDYVLLRCLMQNGAQFRSIAQQMEHRMLMLDFRVMHAWYSISRRVSIRRGREALAEMVDILRHFADTMDECNSAAAH